MATVTALMAQPAAASTYTVDQAALHDLLDEQKHAYLHDPFPGVEQRRADLTRLLDALLARKEAFVKAIDEDFGGRARNDTLLADIFSSVQSIKHARKHLKAWMKPRRRHVPMTVGQGRAYLLPQPLGVIGIVVPWNYPVFLALSPLAAALAAGNRAILKPSEHTPATSALLKEMISAIFPRDRVAVVLGDAAVGRAFSALPFDHLLFTGSTAVGREVMKAAAQNLTPVTLELGGKSPAIVAPDADLASAASDIAFGKLLNAGQTCIAPDYALVPRASLEAFTGELRKAATKYFPEGPSSADLTGIINDRQYQRLTGYVEEARARGVRIEPLLPEGATPIGNRRKMAPVVAIDPPDDIALMRDEIFGPILPVKPYDRIEDAIDYVQRHDRPLALYLFTKSRALIDRMMRATIAGGVSVNDTLMHTAIEDLPFGGVGPSGIGHYHGREGFDTLSKLKPVFERRGPRTDRMLRPPSRRMHEIMLNMLLKR